jgi:hypothetical protein
MLERRQKGAIRQANYEHRKRQNDASLTSRRQNDAGGEGGDLSFSQIDPTKKNDLKIVHTSGSRQNDGRQNDAANVFAFWVEHLGKRSDVKFRGTKRERNVKARLADGYSVDQLCDAIRGCKLSPHHMGKNDTGTVYDDLELICRDAMKVDQFLAIHAKQERQDDGFKRQDDASASLKQFAVAHPELSDDQVLEQWHAQRAVP